MVPLPHNPVLQPAPAINSDYQVTVFVDRPRTIGPTPSAIHFVLIA